MVVLPRSSNDSAHPDLGHLCSDLRTIFVLSVTKHRLILGLKEEFLRFQRHHAALFGVLGSEIWNQRNRIDRRSRSLVVA